MRYYEKVDRFVCCMFLLLFLLEVMNNISIDVQNITYEDSRRPCIQAINKINGDTLVDAYISLSL